MRYRLALVAIGVGFAPPVLAASKSGQVTPSISSAVSDPSRPTADVKVDARRLPAQTLAFAGVRPGMKVGEFFPGGGYFTRMLSDVVGPAGHVYGIENAGWGGAVKADSAMLAEGKLSNVKIAALAFGEVKFAEPLDLVWITQNYHDLKISEFGQVDTAAFNRAVFAALKPGGTYFILDHEAPAGTDLAEIAKLHRIEEAQVIREVTAAGFKLAEEGSFLRRPSDDHTLPIFDERVRGLTDQYALRFVKPNA